MANPALQLTGEVHVAVADQLYDDLALALAGAASDAVKARQAFHLALSGGSTPEPFYERLVLDPRYRTLPWEQTHLWIVDDRRVPEDDERSNWRMIRHTLVDHVPIRRRNCHPMPTTIDDPAGAYAEEMSRLFESLDAARGLSLLDGSPIPRMDFILLGMGDDAHTASLFPHSDALRETERWIANNDGKHVARPARVTMTFPLLNAARQLAVLVIGEKKRATLQRIDEQLRTGGPDVDALPITGVQPADGELTWYLDEAAAGL